MIETVLCFCRNITISTKQPLRNHTRRRSTKVFGSQCKQYWPQLLALFVVLDGVGLVRLVDKFPLHIPPTQLGEVSQSDFKQSS